MMNTLNILVIEDQVCSNIQYNLVIKYILVNEIFTSKYTRWGN